MLSWSISITKKFIINAFKICMHSLGGPLMYFNQTRRSFVLIGTVQGGGYDCRTGQVSTFEGSRNGVWNKVSAHMDWIEITMDKLGETICKN